MCESIAKKIINFDSRYILSMMGFKGFRFLVGLRCKELGLIDAYLDLTLITLFTEKDQPPFLIYSALPASPSYEEIEKAVQKAAETFRISLRR